MFTGLIEAVGEIVAVDSRAGADAGTDGETRGPGQRLVVRTALAGELTDGESLAVNGVCLTMTRAGADRAHADIGPETARVTTLGSLRPGDRVNLERAMRADGRLGGHFVQGHVDGTGTVRQVRTEGESSWVTIAFAGDLARYLIPKGSIAVDGVSLTIAALRDPAPALGTSAEFDVMLIPFTWEHTSLSALTPGSRVNLECDMIGKYVAAQLARIRM